VQDTGQDYYGQKREHVVSGSSTADTGGMAGLVMRYGLRIMHSKGFMQSKESMHMYQRRNG
jgi:hypothetical protein